MKTAHDPGQSIISLKSKGGHHAYTAFDANGYCILPFHTVKIILQCDVKYDENTITLRRNGEVHIFDRDDCPNAWDCVKKLNWLCDDFKTAAIIYLKAHPRF
jgi:hypothetical protein